MGIVSERSVRVLLHWAEGRRLHVRTEIDGAPVLPDEELPLGREFSSSYRAFLDLHGNNLEALGAAVGGAVFPGVHGGLPSASASGWKTASPTAGGRCSATGSTGKPTSAR